jgi:hypothetical protein
MAHRFNVVAFRVNDEGTVIVRVIVRTEDLSKASWVTTLGQLGGEAEPRFRLQ